MYFWHKCGELDGEHHVGVYPGQVSRCTQIDVVVRLCVVSRGSQLYPVVSQSFICNLGSDQVYNNVSQTIQTSHIYSIHNASYDSVCIKFIFGKCIQSNETNFPRQLISLGHRTKYAYSITCHKCLIIQETGCYMTLQVISLIIAHEQDLAHVVVWPSEDICIAKFVLHL